MNHQIEFGATRTDASYVNGDAKDTFSNGPSGSLSSRGPRIRINHLAESDEGLVCHVSDDLGRHATGFFFMEAADCFTW